MHALITLNQFKETDAGTVLKVTVPNKNIGEMLVKKSIKKAM
jgi:hypothetical protein